MICNWIVCRQQFLNETGHFVCIKLNGFKYHYLTWIVLFAHSFTYCFLTVINIFYVNHLFAHS